VKRKRTITHLSQGDTKAPVSHHISELRKMLAVCLIALLATSTLAYAFFDQLMAIFQKPLNQTLYYTSPAGGFSFAVRLCLIAGIVVSIPILVNRIFHFVKPAVPVNFHRSFAWYSLFSVILAIVGVTFGYFVSLPGALYFLTNFKSDQIQALITVDSYFTFFSTYLVGYALLFQTPIIMLFINRIKPLEPGSTMKYQKHVIGGSFIVAAILTPTPDPWNQTLMALPIILLYQVGIVLVWWVNRNTNFDLYKTAEEPLTAKIPAGLVSEAKQDLKSRTEQPVVSQQNKNFNQISRPNRRQARAFDIVAAA